MKVLEREEPFWTLLEPGLNEALIHLDLVSFFAHTLRLAFNPERQPMLYHHHVSFIS